MRLYRKKYTPIKRDGKYRIYSQLIGLEEERLGNTAGNLG